MKIKYLIRLVILFAVFLAAPNSTPGGHLPTKSYTTFDGLANDSVNKIVRDSRGFLWFCTGEGLSRFDGFAFKNYTQNEGLPNRNINDFLETADGDFLVATTGGLAVFNPNGTAYRWNVLTSRLEQTADAPPMFRTFDTPNRGDDRKARSVLNLIQSRSGKIFAGTRIGLFQLVKTGDEWSFHKITSALFDENTEFGPARFDSADYLWICASTGIYRMSPEGSFAKMEGDGGGSILVDNQGQIWIGGSGTNSGLRLYTISEGGVSARLEQVYRLADGLPVENAMAEIKQTSDGRILILVGRNLCEFLPNAAEDELKFRVLAHGDFQAIAEDGGGGLWLGTAQEGAWKISQSGFVKYDAADGIPSEDISSLFINPAGELCITSGAQKILRFTNGSFESVVPKNMKSRSWGISYLDFQAANGDWWIPSATGLRIYPKPNSFTDLVISEPKKIYTTADGLFSNNVANLYEDSRGDVWISTIAAPDSLQRWERGTEKIYRYTTADGLPKSNGAVAFGEDSGGNVWIGFYYGGLARYRDGKFQFFTAADGIPVGSINAIFTDKSGRLWVASASRGVFRADDPSGENPKFTNLSTSEGLSSNRANCVTEDDFGQIYVGTGLGVNRFDPAGGNIKFYTQADGLPGSVVSYCRREENGALWFVSRNSLVKYVPQPETERTAPSVYIGGISASGAARKISELGASSLEKMHFASDEHQIKIDFFALGFGAGDRLHYQYKLDNQEWSAPEEQKSVTFNLEAGDYHFAVRAVNADRVSSENPAVFSFTIAPPFHRRWWFLLLAVLLVGAVILIIERTRAARLRGLKNAFNQLSISEQRFRRMIEQSSLGFVIFAPDGRLRSVNHAYEQFWNVTFNQIKDWKMLEDEQLIESGAAAKLRTAFAGENVSIAPIPYDPQKNSSGASIDASAEPRWIQSFAYPIKSEDGELLEVIMVMEDVTENKNAESKLQNVREERLRELEQVRRRIAADLHDDIGSSLTQISIFSEVLQQRVDKTNERVLEPLEFIASSSRELVDAMSDIVWAINPQKDFLSELSGKMRRFAADVFTARDIEFTFDATHFAEEFALGANLRREVFLIFKESVNNIVKHAACRNVKIVLTIENSEIYLSLRDDGTGFETGEIFDGHGLASMKQRAAGLGGTLSIISGKTTGTTTTLIAPLSPNANEKLFSNSFTKLPA